MASIGGKIGSLVEDAVAGITQNIIAGKIDPGEIGVSVLVQLGFGAIGAGVGTLLGNPFVGAYIGNIIGGAAGSIAADLYAGREVSYSGAFRSAGIAAVAGQAFGVTAAGSRGLAAMAAQPGISSKALGETVEIAFERGNRWGGAFVGGLADRAIAAKSPAAAPAPAQTLSIVAPASQAMIGGLSYREAWATTNGQDILEAGRFSPTAVRDAVEANQIASRSVSPYSYTPYSQPTPAQIAASQAEGAKVSAAERDGPGVSNASSSNAARRTRNAEKMGSFFDILSLVKYSDHGQKIVEIP